MTRRALIWMAAAFCAVLEAWPEVRAEIEPRQARVGESFRLEITAVGGDVKEPRVPELPDLRIRPEGAKTEILVVGGQARLVKVRIFAVVAKKPGEYTIPPISIEVDGVEERTEAIPFTVIEGHAPAPPEDAESEVLDEWDDLIRLTLEADKHEVYQGESIVLTVSLWLLNDPNHGKVGARTHHVSWPSTVGFYAIPREPEQSESAAAEDRGFQFTTVQWRQKLYPTSTGELEVGPCVWQGSVSYAPRGSRIASETRYEAMSNRLWIDVKPLPAQPARFTGAVGAYQITAELTKNEIIQGVPLNLVVRVTGDGNPDAIGAPKLPEIPWAYIEPPQTRTGVAGPGEGAAVVREFTYQITPLKAGQCEVPPIDYCFFDPERERYETTRTQPIGLKVLPSAEPGAGPVVASADATLERERRLERRTGEIAGIVRPARSLRRWSPVEVAAPFAVLLPPLLYGGLAIREVRRRRWAGNSRLARSLHARGKCKKRLHHVLESPDPADGLFRALAGYIADKFDAPEAGLTSGDAERLLESNGIPGDLSSGFVKILKTCERARYASQQLSHDEMGALIHGCTHHIDRLETLLRERTRT